ncbi:HAMP domain-containing sensor histidine kinase [Stenotrophomonas sp. C1657]|uniref:sensor histidine kinase n=1 Tax=Stenotrophomonas sp. C1657 TaxID=3077844 RepID=UPI00293CBC9C|nr:HAMP domain-containing sensor histidine kinase [Stenotrophomonas sp. C1657]MDV3516315.1 HAMP domain-containing sensor histidine kinase [Stenotrophomonas sp. C1657]
MLTLSTLLVAQLVSFAVVWAVPSPAAPQMSLLDAVQVMAGRAATPLGLRRWSQASAPIGADNDWMSTVAAAQLRVPRERVRTVWQRTPDPAAVQVQVIKQGQLVQTGPEQRATVEQALLLPGLRWPAFELAVQQPGGRWSVVGANHSELLQWRRQVLLALLAGAVLLAPLVAWLALRLTRPLRRLADASADLSLQSNASLPLDGPREVQVLAAAMNAASERLRGQAHDVTRMLAAVAHDLRTPLTGLRLRADSAPPAQAARMVADIERMSAMIEQVLDYARGELEPPLLQPQDMVALLDDCIQSAHARGVDIRAALPDALIWRADALLLRRALDNLIDNAARYAGAVELRVERVGARLHVEVMDRGPGIAMADRQRLLQPFQRSEASRSRDTGGAGLGLAVAANAAQRHGGDLQLLGRDGGGLVARLALAS